MSTSGNQQAAQTSTPTPDVIDLTDDSDTLPTQPTQRRTSAERGAPRVIRLTRRRPDPSGQGRQDAGPAAAIPALRAPIIDLETLEFGDAAGAPPSTPPPPNAPLTVSNDEFLSLFQEPPSSPGFEILGERSVRPEPPPPTRRSVAERRPTPYVTDEEREASEAPPLPPAPTFRGLPYGLASWIVHAGTRLAGGNTAGRMERNVPQEGPPNRYTYSNGVYTQVPQYNSGSSWQPQPQLQLPRISALDAFQRPRLNYEAQGFELIGAAQMSTTPPPRPASPYKAPRTSGPGFTRKVEEDEIVVCPHCGDELGTGDGDLKQQIWVVKQCGHVSRSDSHV